VSSNGGKCGTAAIGTAAVLTTALLVLRVRVAVETTKTAGDPRAPLGGPWAPLLFRKGARLSPPITLEGALAACWLVVRPARRACRSTQILAVAGSPCAALNACRGLCRRVPPQALQDVRPTSRATISARAARRDNREAHRLARQGTTGARRREVVGTGRGPCLAIRRGHIRGGGGRFPTRRGAATNPTSGSLLDRRLCGARLTRARPGWSTNSEIREARRTSSGF